MPNLLSLNASASDALPDDASPHINRKACVGRILVVDDDSTIRRLCERVLRPEGWEITVAPDGRAAMQTVQASKLPFDCVLSDVKMPELDGFDLAAAVHAHDDDVPVLLMTGDPSLDGAVRAIDLGAVSYISKPFGHEELASAVARAARRHNVTRRRRRADSHVRTFGPRDADDLLEQRFARAIESAWMAFQPIVDVTNKRVFAYEALLRTDEESLRRPDILIAAAERLGRIHVLGRTVRAAVAAAARLAPADALMFVNVHGVDLTDEDLFASGTPLAELAPRVVLEITERTGLDAEAAPARIAMLRRLGYRIAIDDLGAGYSGLDTLAALEPEIVKLDMSLIRGIECYPTKLRIVRAIAAMCRDLGGQVIAEGVETEAERAAVVGAGIELLQGYLFAKPTREFAHIAW